MKTAAKAFAIAAAVLAAPFPLMSDIDITLKLGGPTKSGGTASVWLRWDDPSVVPHIEPSESVAGHMEVITGEVTRCIFYANGIEEPITEYLLKPGPKVFTLIDIYMGKVKDITTWTYEDDGSTTMERRDPDGKVLYRNNYYRKTSRDGKSTYARRKVGDILIEEEFMNVPKRGSFKVLERHGTGENATWERMAPYLEDPMFFREHSRIDSDGDWTIWEYAPPPTISNHTYTSKTIRPKGRADAITNETGLVTEWKGTAIVTEYSFEAHEPEDDFTHDPYEPRTVYTYELTDGGEIKPLKRRFYANFIRDGEFITIYERAATPDAVYGAAGNKRHAVAKEWNGRIAGYKTWELSEDGVMTVYGNDTYAVNGVRMRIQENYSTTPDHPDATPYETVTTRTFYDDCNRVLREEHWIVLENDGRELLDWKAYARNHDGLVTNETSSAGRTIEQRWMRGHLLERKDMDGNITTYGYDAIDRLVKYDGATIEENMRYDLASQMTNLYGSVYGRKHDISFEYDNTGSLFDSKSDEGEKHETVEEKDGSVKTYLNGHLVATYVSNGPYEHWTYYGPRGKDSPRWHKQEWDPNGKFYVETFPKLGGGVTVKTNIIENVFTTRDVASQPREKYAKKRGFWWREHMDEDGNKVLRRITGLGDGSSDTIYIDKDGRERSVLRLVDRDKGVTVIKVTRPESNLPEITIEKNGEVVESVSFSGVTNRYERGVQGRIEAIHDGRGGVTKFIYDDKGRRATTTDRCGVTTRFAYDARGRIVREETDDGKPPRIFEYDDFGRIVAMRHGDNSIRYTYNEYGDNVSMTLTDGNKRYKVENEYDEATGLLLRRKIDGAATKFGYGDSGELTDIDGVVINAHEAAFTNGLKVAKDKFGRSVGYSIAGQTKLTRNFDKTTGRVESVAVEGLGEAKFRYLAGTDLVEAIEYPNGVTATIEYDAEDELVKIEYAGLGNVPKSYGRIECGEIQKRLMRLDEAASALKRKPLVEDKMTYLDFAGACERPIAEMCDDGKLRWCILDAEGKARGVMK